uniref:Cytochrome c oxidase assembly factor 3 n=1 Tax=Steinernema glaseri TaxID=37863 RepID=A0A1I7Z4G8_9BILA
MTLRLSAVSASFVSKLPRIVARRTAATVPTTPSPVTNKKSDVINQRADMLEQIDIEDLPRAQKRFAKQFEQVNDERIKEIFAKNYKNHISLSALLLLVVGIYYYTIYAVKQETFLEEIDEEVAVERAQKAHDKK